MVVWEITLATAYFLGLKRSYRLALRLQRRLFGSKYPKIRAILQRRTHGVFNVALRIHRNIQQRDIHVGRNLGNWILRCLDRIKPSAEIRSSPSSDTSSAPNIMKNTTTKPLASNSVNQETCRRSDIRKDDRHMFSPTKNIWTNTFPAVVMLIRPTTSVVGDGMWKNRQVWTSATEIPRSMNAQVFRRDIMQWMVSK